LKKGGAGLYPDEEEGAQVSQPWRRETTTAESNIFRPDRRVAAARAGN